MTSCHLYGVALVTQENQDTFVPLRLIAYLTVSLNISVVFSAQFFKPVGALGLSHGFFLAAKYSCWLASTLLAFGADLQQLLPGKKEQSFHHICFTATLQPLSSLLFISPWVTNHNLPQGALQSVLRTMFPAAIRAVTQQKQQQQNPSGE